MADGGESSVLLDTARLELEKTCVYLITAYVRMLEKPKDGENLMQLIYNLL